MIVLIFGLSGVGKSAASQAVEPRFPCTIIQDLDGLAASWAVEKRLIDRECVQTLRSHIADEQLFLGFGLQAIGVLATRYPDRHLVNDVGAGFQDARSTEQYEDTNHEVDHVIARSP